jgi:hypothetical protein
VDCGLWLFGVVAAVTARIVLTSMSSLRSASLQLSSGAAALPRTLGLFKALVVASTLRSGRCGGVGEPLDVSVDAPALTALLQRDAERGLASAVRRRVGYLALFAAVRCCNCVAFVVFVCVCVLVDLCPWLWSAVVALSVSVMSGAVIACRSLTCVRAFGRPGRSCRRRVCRVSRDR